MIITLAICIIFASIGAKLGESRGRALAGGVWGFLLGPLGWLVIIAGPGRQCPACRSNVHVQAIMCPNCRTHL